MSYSGPGKPTSNVEPHPGLGSGALREALERIERESSRDQLMNDPGDLLLKVHDIAEAALARTTSEPHDLKGQLFNMLTRHMGDEFLFSKRLQATEAMLKALEDWRGAALSISSQIEPPQDWRRERLRCTCEAGLGGKHGPACMMSKSLLATQATNAEVVEKAGEVAGEVAISGPEGNSRA